MSVGGVAVRVPKSAGAELYRRVVLGKEKVKFLAGVVDLERRAPPAVVQKVEKSGKKWKKSAIRPVAGRDFTAPQWISVKKR